MWFVRLERYSCTDFRMLSNLQKLAREIDSGNDPNIATRKPHPCQEWPQYCSVSSELYRTPSVPQIEPETFAMQRPGPVHCAKLVHRAHRPRAGTMAAERRLHAPRGTGEGRGGEGSQGVKWPAGPVPVPPRLVTRIAGQTPTDSSLIRMAIGHARRALAAALVHKAESKQSAMTVYLWAVFAPSPVTVITITHIHPSNVSTIPSMTLHITAFMMTFYQSTTSLEHPWRFPSPIV